MSLRILIVDDDLSMRMLLAEYFRRLGFEVEEKESAEEALERALSGAFDCFIFDVTMPGMSGLELLRRVRDRGVETPAMFSTSSNGWRASPAGRGRATTCSTRSGAPSTKATSAT
ncbi:MAG: response regulator [Acidobacteria bacterium]|nr:response regulator [Acidobacteriota bacterium]